LIEPITERKVDMRTQSFCPPPSIASHVINIMVIENTVPAEFILPLFANGSPTLVFQTCIAKKQNQTIDQLTLYGQTVRPSEIVIRESFTLIAYFFFPLSLKKLFGFSASELTDNCIEVDSLQPAREARLKEKLLNTSSLIARIELLNDFIFKMSERVVSDAGKIEYATIALRKNIRADSLASVQDELGISERTLQRLFESNVGISPKIYRRICQFHSAFQQLNKRQFRLLSDVAFDNGYVDQSHFIRVFKEFTNLTPKEYLDKIPPQSP
jgi:AraC-like DNA-binding protein